MKLGDRFVLQSYLEMVIIFEEELKVINDVSKVEAESDDQGFCCLCLGVGILAGQSRVCVCGFYFKQLQFWDFILSVRIPVVDP